MNICIHFEFLVNCLFETIFFTAGNLRINNVSFKILKLAIVLVFAGRDWQHIFWNVPFRNFFFDEQLLKPIIEEVFAAIEKKAVKKNELFLK